MSHITSNPNEEWRGVTGLLVSNLGQVRNPKTGRLLKGNRHGNYLRVLTSDGRKYTHCLVAEAFLGPRPPGNDVRHKNDNGLDNRAVNLEYGSRSQNMLDVWRTGKYRGVDYLKRENRWRARVMSQYLGLFDTEIEAAQAVNKYILDNKLNRRLNPV